MNVQALTARLLALVAIAIALQGCATSVRMKPTELPDALVDQWPLTAAVRYDESLVNFVYEEKLASGERYSIDLGPASQQMFRAALGQMFETVIEVEPDATNIPPVDLLIDASVAALEFVTPSQTVTKDYAVWIKFNVRVFDNTGKVQAEYPLSAYGKSGRNNFMTNGEASLRQATELALRDGAVLLLTRFDVDGGLRGRQLPKVARVANAPLPTPAVPVATEPTPESAAKEDSNGSDETDTAENYL
ncbi:MAG: hypothetical protein AAFO81_08030 [Pseudomonadota bacterium]